MRALRAGVLGAWEWLNRALGAELGTGLSIARRLPARIAARPIDRVWIALAAVLLSSGRMHRPVRIRVRGPDGPRRFSVPDWAAMKVLEEVFVHGEYANDAPEPPRRILDLGSNIGASILFFALVYPTAAVVGVEPSRELFELLVANVGDLRGVTLHNGAVAAEPGPITFYEADASWAGSTLLTGALKADGHYTVDGLALDDLLRDGDTDLVKLDIEGGEFDVLPASELLPGVRTVLGEIHAPPDDPRTHALLALLPDHRLDVAPDTKDGWYTVFAATRNDA